MANILLLGNAECLIPFGTGLGSHALFVLDDDHAGTPAIPGATVISAPDEMPGAPDAIFELSLKSGDRLYNLYRAEDFAVQGFPILFVNALTITATEAATDYRPDCAVVGISYIPAMFAASRVIEAAPALQTTPEAAEKAIEFLGSVTGKDVETVQDRLGLVSARVLATVINEAAFAVMEGVATPGEVDTAMRLGTNYPEGPLQWCDRIGAESVVSILDALFDEYGEERYRPCVLLKQYARAGKPFIPH